jgi:hypothetical protein
MHVLSFSAGGHFSMRWITIFSSVCLGLFVVTCAVMWELGVFSGVSTKATIGALLGILFATAIGTALMALAIYSDQSGHDEVIFRIEPDKDA